MAGNNSAFLGVERSVSGLRWTDRLDPREANIALAIAQTHGIPDLVSRVLAGRGVGVDASPGFLDPTLKSLMPDPLSLTDMGRAAERIAHAVRRGESVAIFGDYDVDGACSSALMARFLRHYGIDARIYIPDRIFEGYGPNPDAMRGLAGEGAKLIVTVDCGTNSAEAIHAAGEAGADVVVLDHHQQGGDLPEAAEAVVNPNREDDMSGQGHLCAAGIVFLTLVQVARLLREKGGPSVRPPDLLANLDLVAFATVCDVVPLVGLNRAFVTKGLIVARKQENAGIRALARAARIGEPINAFHLAFLMGPRVNAGGRIGDAALGARLLTMDDTDEAEKIAAELDRLNQERQVMEQVMLEEAEAEAAAELMAGEGPAVVVTESDTWHAGIVGLIAARLKERSRRPAFAIAFNANGLGTGSGRSIPGFDLGHLVRDAVDKGLLVKGGGHAMAAGITVEREKLGALRAYFEEEAAAAVRTLRDSESLKIDGALSASGATIGLFEELEKAGPYGSGHPQPMLVLPRHRLLDARMVGKGHYRVTVAGSDGGRLNGIAFRAEGGPLGDFLRQNLGQTVHLAGNLSVNHWNGRSSAQLRVVDAAPG